MLEHIHAQTKEKYGKIVDFEEFIREQKEGLAEISKEGRKLYGDHYLQIITDKIYKKHDLTREFFRKYFKRYFKRDSYSGYRDSYSSFFDHLSNQIEDFLDKKWDGDCSWESFEQVVKTPRFREALKTEMERQRFLELIENIMKVQFEDSQKREHISNELDLYLSNTEGPIF